MKTAVSPSAISAAQPTGVNCEAMNTAANEMTAATNASGVSTLRIFSRTAALMSALWNASTSRSVGVNAAICSSDSSGRGSTGARGLGAWLLAEPTVDARGAPGLVSSAICDPGPTAGLLVAPMCR